MFPIKLLPRIAGDTAVAATVDVNMVLNGEKLDPNDVGIDSGVAVVEIGVYLPDGTRADNGCKTADNPNDAAVVDGGAVIVVVVVVVDWLLLVVLVVLFAAVNDVVDEFADVVVDVVDVLLLS